MKMLIVVLSFLVTTCRAKHEILPPVEPIDHNRIKQMIEQNRGKVVLVNVWATWCAPCLEEMPALVKLRGGVRENALKLVLVSADDPEFLRTRVQPMLKEFGIDFPTYIKAGTDDEAFINAMSAEWNGALPASFVYDSEGRLVDMLIGGKQFEQFEQAVKKALES